MHSFAPAVRRPHRGIVLLATIVALVVAVAGWDLAGPLRTDIRVFDARAVARLDTEMWRSYYDRRPVVLFGQLAELMREQFHFPWLRSHLAAFWAARAAVVFQRGAGRDDYRGALPDLIRYYRMIRRASVTSFDVERTAALELEWWIVHRERAGRPAADLERALAGAASELYRVPATGLGAYARDRAAAMTVRDTSAAARRLGDAGWARIEELLDSSWSALSDHVRPAASALGR